MNDDEDEFLSVDEINAMLEHVSKKDKPLISLLIEQNSDLLDALLDMQEFMLDKGFTSEQYKGWMEDKGERIYH